MDYVKERVLGKGSFGTVYLVRRPQGPYRVIKEVALSGDEAGDNGCDRVGHEGRLLAQLDHPNIIRHFESFVQSSPAVFCLVMEFCPGGDLHQLIRRRRGVHLVESKVVEWFRQLASALDYLHARKILHRDVKTGNIFVSQDGRTLKLGDFGAAKMLQSTGEMSNTCVGTPTYLSPEMCGRKEYDAKSDVWALGCVLYHLTTLRPPFSGRTVHQLLGQILRAHFPPMPARYSYELRTAIGSLLRKNPDERPTAEAILKKRLFAHQNMATPSSVRRASSAPPSKMGRKSLGTLAVYATPLLLPPKRVKGRTTPRRRWNAPTQTLVSALSSLGLGDRHSDSSDQESLLFQQTCVLKVADSPYHRHERWAASLEASHGVHLMKQARQRWENEPDSIIVEDHELAEFLAQERSIYIDQ